jgi:hypothetical protein
MQLVRDQANRTLSLTGGGGELKIHHHHLAESVEH